MPDPSMYDSINKILSKYKEMTHEEAQAHQQEPKIIPNGSNCNGVIGKNDFSIHKSWQKRVVLLSESQMVQNVLICVGIVIRSLRAFHNHANPETNI